MLNRSIGVVGLNLGVAAWAIPVIARITGDFDGFAAAEAAANVALDSPLSRLIIVAHARIGLALMAGEREDAAASHEQYRPMESLSGTMFITCSITVDRILGLLD